LIIDNRENLEKFDAFNVFNSFEEKVIQVKDFYLTPVCLEALRDLTEKKEESFLECFRLFEKALCEKGDESNFFENFLTYKSSLYGTNLSKAGNKEKESLYTKAFLLAADEVFDSKVEEIRKISSKFAISKEAPEQLKLTTRLINSFLGFFLVNPFSIAPYLSGAIVVKMESLDTLSTLNANKSSVQQKNLNEPKKSLDQSFDSQKKTLYKSKEKFYQKARMEAAQQRENTKKKKRPVKGQEKIFQEFELHNKCQTNWYNKNIKKKNGILYPESRLIRDSNGFWTGKITDVSTKGQHYNVEKNRESMLNNTKTGKQKGTKTKNDLPDLNYAKNLVENDHSKSSIQHKASGLTPFRRNDLAFSEIVLDGEHTLYTRDGLLIFGIIDKTGKTLPDLSYSNKLSLRILSEHSTLKRQKTMEEYSNSYVDSKSGMVVSPVLDSSGNPIDKSIIRGETMFNFCGTTLDERKISHVGRQELSLIHDEIYFLRGNQRNGPILMLPHEGVYLHDSALLRNVIIDAVKTLPQGKFSKQNLPEQLFKAEVRTNEALNLMETWKRNSTSEKAINELNNDQLVLKKSFHLSMSEGYRISPKIYPSEKQVADSLTLNTKADFSPSSADYQAQKINLITQDKARCSPFFNAQSLEKTETSPRGLVRQTDLYQEPTNFYI